MLVLAAAACGEAPASTAAPDAGGPYVTAGDAGRGRDAAVCTGSPLHAYDESPGVLSQVWVDLPSGDTTGPFIVDMGSPFSYWAAPPLGDGGTEITYDGGATTLSCAPQTFPILHGVSLGSTPNGAPAAGALGVDLVKKGAGIDLRIADALFVWWHSPPPTPDGATVVPLELHTSRAAYNMLVASGVTLDGKDVRLVLDTGSPHVLVVSATPRSGETKIPGQDANGDALTLYESTIEIAFNGGPRRTVTVDRAATFPGLEQALAVLGADVVGLLGINTLGHDRIVITSEALSFVP